MKTQQSAKRFFLVLLVGTTVMLGAVLLPLASGLFMACVLAAVLRPLSEKLANRLRHRRGIAAGILIFAVVTILVGPLIALSAVVVKEASEGITYVSEIIESEGTTGLVDRLPQPLRKLGHEVIERIPRKPGVDVDKTVQEKVTAQTGTAAAAVGTAVTATWELLFQLSMMLIALFFLLVHGQEFMGWLDDVSPLRKGQTRELLAEFKHVSYSVLVSTVITCAVQAFAALIGYLIARVPHPLFFAAVTFFVAFVPAVGAGAVCLAAAGLLFLTGHSYMALFLAIWGVVIVGLADNLIKPYLMVGGMEMHGAVVFFALLGGLASFGAIGLLLGPLVVALFLALLRMYHRDFSAPDVVPVLSSTPVGSGDPPVRISG